MEQFIIVAVAVSAVVAGIARKEIYVPTSSGEITVFVPYTLVIDTAPKVSTVSTEVESGEVVSIRVEGELSGDHDWVGIYRVGDSSDRANLLG